MSTDAPKTLPLPGEVGKHQFKCFICEKIFGSFEVRFFGRGESKYCVCHSCNHNLTVAACEAKEKTE